MEKVSKYAEILKKQKLKTTPQRCAVLEVLDNSGKPLTIEEIYKLLIKENVSINISTVFRILESFFEKGITTKEIIGGEQRAYYEMALEKHKHYFYCVNCRGMFPIDACPISAFEESVKKALKCKITGHRFEVSGYCEECASVQ